MSQKLMNIFKNESDFVVVSLVQEYTRFADNIDSVSV